MLANPRKVVPEPSTAPAALAELVSVSATLLSVPATILYLVGGLVMWGSAPDFSKYPLLPLLLVSIWLGQICLSLVGLTAGMVHVLGSKSWRGLSKMCVLINASIIGGNLAFMLAGFFLNRLATD